MRILRIVLKGEVNKMRVLRIMLITIILGGLAVSLISCASKSDSSSLSANQVVTVQRGNITIDITASGNLAYSDYQDLAFQISGASTQVPLTVAEVDVQAGDPVYAGQVIAKADPVYLQEALTTTTRAEQTAEIALEQATDSWRQITWPYGSFTALSLDIPTADSYISNAQQQLNDAIAIMQELGLSQKQYDWTQYWNAFTYLQNAQNYLNYAGDYMQIGQGVNVFSLNVVPQYSGQPYGGQNPQNNTASVLNPSIPGQGGSETIIPQASYWSLRSAQENMQTAQVALDTAKDNLGIAQYNQKYSVITAPYDGYVTIVNLVTGTTIEKGVVAVRIVDSTKFEADFQVSEMDIFKLKLGQAATVQVSAASSLNLPANLFFLSPTGTITSGVVTYQAKVELQSVPKNIQLRDGLTVTVSIPVQEKDNVLEVPNAAITSQGGNSYVQVISPSGTIEQRLIQTGITDYQNTEVIKGLSEGEKVVVPQGTATTTTQTTQQSRPAGGMMRIPGMGGR